MVIKYSRGKVLPLILTVCNDTSLSLFMSYIVFEAWHLPFLLNCQRTTGACLRKPHYSMSSVFSAYNNHLSKSYQTDWTVPTAGEGMLRLQRGCLILMFRRIIIIFIIVSKPIFLISVGLAKSWHLFQREGGGSKNCVF